MMPKSGSTHYRAGEKRDEDCFLDRDASAWGSVGDHSRL